MCSGGRSTRRGRCPYLERGGRAPCDVGAAPTGPKPPCHRTPPPVVVGLTVSVPTERRRVGRVGRTDLYLLSSSTPEPGVAPPNNVAPCVDRRHVHRLEPTLARQGHERDNARGRAQGPLRVVHRSRQPVCRAAPDGGGDVSPARPAAGA